MCGPYEILEITERRIQNQIAKGLINVIGSIIKSLIDNFNAEYAQKYDNAMNEVSKNQNSMKTLV